MPRSRAIITISIYLCLATLNISCAVSGSKETRQDLKLWYDTPAETWEQALPVGNGRLGAMVFGGIAQERIQLNEDSMWAGPPVPEAKPGMYEALEEARALIFKGEYEKAEQVAQQSLPPRISPRSHQTLGDLHLTFDLPGEVSVYRRELDLDTAIATTTFVIDGVQYTREVFSSAVDQVLAVRLSASDSGRISLEATLDRPVDYCTHSENEDMLVMHGQVSHKGKHLGVHYCARLLAKPEGGSMTAKETSLVIKNADRVTFYLAAATDYNAANPSEPFEMGYASQTCQKQLEAAVKKSYKKGVLADHLSEHRRLFRRVSLDLGSTKASVKPTDQRLEALKNGAVDPALATLYFQFGRYLLMCSSRPGTLPANLQGLWNKHIEAPWHADYHININIQMNYWPAEVCNLSECQDPFFDFIERVLDNSRDSARDIYHCRGVVGHHTTDVWYWSVPIGSTRWGMWPLGGAWCAQHFMERYRFTEDKDFLRERAWPVLKDNSLFFMDYLVENPDTGKLVAGPCNSPENQYESEDGQKATIDMGASANQQIVWDLFTNTLEAAAILGVEDDFTREVRISLEKLALPQIGPDGRLMEWSRPFKETEPGHRHIAHVYAMHPGRQYTFSKTPEMMKAIRQTIDYRLAHGSGHTGWSRAWIVNMWARLLEAEKAHENLIALFTKSTHPNLFDNHPPFQIDGNFGGAAGIAEMLLQSHEDDIHLLPSLPAAWPDGSVTGLCARGGFVVDMEWQGGILTKATILSKNGNPCIVRYKNKQISIDTQKGKTVIITLADFL